MPSRDAVDRLAERLARHGSDSEAAHRTAAEDARALERKQADDKPRPRPTREPPRQRVEVTTTIRHDD